MYMLVDHGGDMQLCMLELVRELMNLLMQFLVRSLLQDDEAGSACNLSPPRLKSPAVAPLLARNSKIEIDVAGGGLALLKSRRSAAIVVTEAGESKTIRDFYFLTLNLRAGLIPALFSPLWLFRPRSLRVRSARAQQFADRRIPLTANVSSPPVPSRDITRAPPTSRSARCLHDYPLHPCGSRTSPTTTAKRTSSTEPPRWPTRTAAEPTLHAAHATAPANPPVAAPSISRNSPTPLVPTPQPPSLHCTPRRTRSHVVPPSRAQLR